jgi:hypothetical protein
MSTYTKSSTAIKKRVRDEAPELEIVEPGSAQIIPWSEVKKIKPRAKGSKKAKTRLDCKYLYHRGHKIPILHFQKSGYDKLLYLLVKEIER